MFDVVGNRNGRKAVRWGRFFFATLVIVLVSTLFSLAVYYLVAGRWNPTVLLLGAGAGVFIAGVVIILNLTTPLQRLPIIR